MTTYEITFELDKTIEANDRNEAIEKFIEDLRDMSDKDIKKILEVRWYE